MVFDLDRQFLHAKELGFVHPYTGKKLKLSSDLPKDHENIIKALKKAKKKLL